MSVESFGVKQTFLAAADYQTKQFYLMYISAADTVTICGAAGLAIGILYNKPNTGEAAEVLTASGVFARVITGGSISAGNTLESDSSGRAVAYTYDGDGTTETYNVGYAVEDGGGANSYCTILTQFCLSSK